MTDLTDVKVTLVNGDYPNGHRLIEVSAPTWDADDEHLRAPRDYLRGKLARVALMAAEDMKVERAVHVGCRLDYPPSAVRGSDGTARMLKVGLPYPTADESVVFPENDSDGSRCRIVPRLTLDDLGYEDCTVEFIVPKNRTRLWVAKIGGWLQQVMEP